MGLVESLKEELGRPLIDWDGSAVHAHRQPIVYLWLRGDAVLYIGQSAMGVQRPLGSHERLQHIEATDRLVVFTVKTAKMALALEDRLIRRLNPQLNGPGGWRPVMPRQSDTELQDEERSLARDLDAVRRQIEGRRTANDTRERRQRKRADNQDSLYLFDASNPECLSPVRAGKKYSVRAGAIRAAVESGTLRAIRIGISMRFRPEWIEEWLMLRGARIAPLVDAVDPSATDPGTPSTRD